jgi:3-deoxy-D-manno-octulosonic-acid transferase
MPRLFYTLAIHALLPWALLHLLWRARRQPEYLQHWSERFGFYRRRPEQPLIWIHAVSVGETRAAQPLVVALRTRYPGYRILITHMTPTGRATSASLYGDTVERVYLPYDTPWAMRHFLRHFRPALGIIMETELWPNLITACKQSGVPLLLVNARLSEKSAQRYARYPNLTRAALEQLTGITAIGTDDARRLQALGAPTVETVGNMKFDIEPPEEQLAIARDFRTRYGNRQVLLCASTREGEEALILDAWQKVGAGPSQADAPPVGGSEPGLRAWGANKVGVTAGNSFAGTGGMAPLLAIVPRHPQRFDEVASLVAAREFKVQRRSDNAPLAADTQVWLGDSMGEMFAYYAAADVAFVGASLIDLGSQNLIEPCAVGVPVLIGPSTFNFPDAARDALSSGAAYQVPNAQQLVDMAARLLADETTRKAMGAAGRAFAARHRGATRRTLELVEGLMPPSGRPKAPCAPPWGAAS